MNRGVNGGREIGENCDASGESGGRGGVLRLPHRLGGEATKSEKKQSRMGFQKTRDVDGIKPEILWMKSCWKSGTVKEINN